jgi:hypothetical protein
MAVVDRSGRLGLKGPSERERYDVLTKTLYILGKPDLLGSPAVRLMDSIMIRAFSMVFNFGKKAATGEEEYSRLTGNFKRIGKIALRLAFLGPVTRFFLRAAMRSCVNMLGRQKLFGLNNEKTDVRTAAARYFTATDIFDFKIEVDHVDENRVQFRFLECPIGYVSGNDMKICMASNKWDRQCVRMMGARMIIDELIPEGSPACQAQIVPEGEKVPVHSRRYPRLTI